MRLLDVILCGLTLIATAVAAPVYAAWLGAWVIGARLTAPPRSGRRALLVLSEASHFAELEQAGLLPLFEEWRLDGYFSHLYLAVFHAPRRRWHRVSEGFTVIDLAKRGRWLKQTGLPRTYAAVNAVALAVGVLGLRRLAWREAAVIRACNPHHMGLLGLVLGRLTGRPHCVSIHSDNPTYYRQWNAQGRWANSQAALFGSRRLTLALMQAVYRWAPEVWIIRESFRQEALRCGASSERIRLFPHSSRIRELPASDAAAWRAAHDVGPRPLIVAVGRLAVENFIDDVPRLAAALARRTPEAVLVLVGDGPERARVQATAVAQGLTAIRWVGWQPNTAVRQWQAAADVNLCLRGGYSLIEAAAAGRPVVAYDTDWHHELVQTGETGALVPVGDAEAAAEAIARLLAHPAEAARQGAKARALALARHDHAVVTPVKQRLYDELSREPRATASAVAAAWSGG